jgi:hypothetical protein
MLRIKWLAAVIATTLGFGIIAALPAQAAIVRTNVIKNHADDCGGGNHWANTTFTRKTTIVKTVDEVGPKDTYKVTISDDGIFNGIYNAPSLFDTNRPLLRSISGSMTGGATYTVKGSLKTSYDNDGDVYDDNNTQNTNCAGSWPSKFFKTGYTGGINNDWGWTYKTLDETMVNAAAGNSGNITGKLTSKLTAANKCRMSKSDKRNVWTVSNVQGDRSRTFSYWIKYNNAYSAHWSATVAPGQTIQVITPYGGRLTVSYWDGYNVNKRLYVYSKASILCT